MRNAAILVSILLSYSTTSCHTAVIAYQPEPVARRDTNSKNHADSVRVDYVIFGRFCGECGGHCATMYRYYGSGNANTLWVDSTDSYFKRAGQIVFGQQLFEHRRFLQAQHILSSIPETLLGYPTATGAFGCPDCTDGCGIYLEFGQSGKVRKFTIDYQTGQLTGDIKKFAELIKTAIDSLESH